MAAIPTGMKLALDAAGSEFTIMVFRALIAIAITVGVVVLIQGRHLRPGPLGRKYALLSGAHYALTSYALVVSIQRIPVSLTILLFFLHPIMLAIWAHFTGEGRLSAVRLCFAFLVFAGLCLVIGPDLSRLDPIGIAWGLVSAVAVSAMIVCNNRGQADTPSAIINIYMTGFTAVLFIAIVLVFDEWALPQTQLGWIGIVGAGVGLGLGILAFFESFRYIGAVRASMISNLEPVLGVVVASWVLGERFGFAQWTGIVAVLLGLILFETTGLTRAKMR